MCAYAFKFKVHCRSVFEPGASRLPYYCTPLVCVSAVRGTLAVWRLNQKKGKKSAATTNDNDDNAINDDFNGNLGEIFGASSMVTPSLDLDLAFGVVDSNVDHAHTQLIMKLHV